MILAPQFKNVLTALAAILFLLALNNLAMAQESTTLIKGWFERAALGDVTYEQAKESNAPLKLGKWYSPIRIQIFDELLPDAQRKALNVYIRDYAKTLTETTNLTISIVPEGGQVKPNLILFIDENVVRAVEAHMPVVREVFLNDDKYIREKFLLGENHDKVNCYYRIPVGADGIAARGIIVAPKAEDLYATTKCLAQRLYQSMALPGVPADPESVVHRESAIVEPTFSDREALAIHYLPSVDRGVTVQDVESIVGNALKNGQLKLK